MSHDNQESHIERRKTRDALADFARTASGGRGQVALEEFNDGLVLVFHLVPRNPRAVSVTVVCEQFLVVGIGTIGGRWELGYEEVSLAQRLIEAAIAGRVAEHFAPSRSRVDVSFPNGTTASQTGVRGHELPSPGRRVSTTWDRTIQYEPYGEGPS
ncbi:MAG TPA: hypothetical protein VIL55_05040 [Naasia sp.]|jgi:hypothetical protein